MKKSETLVILGNGPSLKGFDFARLRRFDVIGMNAAYRYWDEIGWYPTYYICLDTVDGVSHKQEITRLIRESEQNGIKVFILRQCLIKQLPNDVLEKAAILDFDVLRKTLPIFRKTQPITTGSHSAIMGAMFGYNHIFLLGVDCNYVEQVDGSIKREGTVLEIDSPPELNPNYFFDGYQRSGDKYNVPNPVPDLHVNAWQVAARVLAKRGVEVWNGSPKSRVKDFPFHDFSHLEKSVNFLFHWFQTVKDLRVSAMSSTAGSRADSAKQQQSDVA